MYKKLTILGLSALILGGCAITNPFVGNQAAQDALPTSSSIPEATVTTFPDAALQAMPSTSTANDPASLEKDINNTQIAPEDFSNIK
jgi:hypothetical protein